MSLSPHSQLFRRSFSSLCLALVTSSLGFSCASDPEDAATTTYAAIDCDADDGLSTGKDEVPHARKTSIKGVTAIGDCKVDATVAPDGQSVTLVLREFFASIDEQSEFDRADCRVTLAVDNPAGQSFALTELVGSGTISLADGVTAAIATTHSFTALPKAGEHVETFVGPERKDVRFEAAFAENAATYSPCGTNRNLELSLQVVIRNNGAPATSRIDLTGLGPLRLALRACT